MANISYKDVIHWGSKLFIIAIATFVGCGTIGIWTYESMEIRKEVLDRAKEEVKQAYASEQTVYAPVIMHCVENIAETDTAEKDRKYSHLSPTKLNYMANAKTETLRRSIYKINVYTSSVQVSGSFTVNERMRRLPHSIVMIPIADAKGLTAIPQITLGGQLLNLKHGHDGLQARFTLPDSVEVGDSIAFSYHLNLKGTEDLMFQPFAEETSLTLTSSHQHPSFEGSFLPNQHVENPDGFEASWKVIAMNKNYSEYKMGASFVNPVDPYRQYHRAVSYSLVIILVVFAAFLLVEFLTKKNFSNLQYCVICASIVMFYALLLVFHHLMIFWLAYFLAAAMNVITLTCYSRAILRNRTAYLLGALLTLIYTYTYIMLLMYSYALLTGTLLLFTVLCVIMFITAAPGLPHKESEAIKEDIDAAQESEQTTEEPEKAAEK